MTSNYSFPPSMALATREDGSLETRDNAVMRELQVTPPSLPYYLTFILPLVSFSNPLPLVSLSSLSRCLEQRRKPSWSTRTTWQPPLLNQTSSTSPTAISSTKSPSCSPSQWFLSRRAVFGLFPIWLPLFALFCSCLFCSKPFPAFLGSSLSLPPYSRGPVRKLPATVIDLIKTVNRLKLGQLLCRCRSPDFLLDIIRRQVSPLVPNLASRVRLHFSVFTLFNSTK